MMNLQEIQSLFVTRLTTLELLLRKAEDAFGGDAFLERRIAADMLPLGTQLAFTCNQPRNFALWSRGLPADNLDPDVTTVKQGYRYLEETKQSVQSLACEDSKLSEKLTEMTRIDLGPTVYIELSGREYLNEFLIPNFYFHLVTAYNVLRMSGLSIGKSDYMQHLVPLLRHGA